MPQLHLVENNSLVASSGAPAPVVMRLGLRDEFVFEKYDGYGLTVIGRTAAQACTEPSLTKIAREKYFLDVLFDCDTWRNELEPDDRSAGFKKAKVNFEHKLDPRLQSLTAAQEERYVAAAFEEAARAHATIWTAPYHTSGGGPDCPARRLDLRLANIAARRFRSSGLDQDGKRKLFAVIAIDPRELRDPLVRVALVALYGAMSVDGFVVKPINFSETSALQDVDAVAFFIGELRHFSGLPVVSAGTKNLGLPLVAGQLASAVMIGIGEGRRVSCRREREGRLATGLASAGAAERLPKVEERSGCSTCRTFVPALPVRLRPSRRESASAHRRRAQAPHVYVSDP